MTLTTHHKLPPFPDDIPTAPLVSISLAKLQAGDEAESTAFFEACKGLGFFYLDTSGSKLGELMVEEAEKLHKVQQELFKLPKAEKDQYGRDQVDQFYAYRFTALCIPDEDGSSRRNESYNIRKDDIIGNCDRLSCHPMILETQPLLSSYVRHCRQAIDLMISRLEVSLQLPPGTLANLHRINERSGDHVRFNQAGIQPYDEQQAMAGEHTDFGTLTILFNWLGGLQIRHPETNEWIYVKPIPGSAVVNLGDALVKFTAGILRSNIHRVVPPPGAQANLTRNSLVYFSRPEDAVVLKRLKGGLIDQQPVLPSNVEEMTSAEWIMRRAVGDLKGVYTHTGGLEYRPFVYS